VEVELRFAEQGEELVLPVVKGAQLGIGLQPVRLGNEVAGRDGERRLAHGGQAGHDDGVLQVKNNALDDDEIVVGNKLCSQPGCSARQEKRKYTGSRNKGGDQCDYDRRKYWRSEHGTVKCENLPARKAPVSSGLVFAVNIE